MDDDSKRKSPLVQKLKKLVRHKLFIAFALFLFLVGGAAGWAYYYFLIPNPTVHKELDESFGADFFEDFHLEYDLDIDEVEKTAGADSDGEDEEGTEEEKDASGQDEKDGENAKGERSPSEKEKQEIEDQRKAPGEISKEDIVNKHRPRFNSLQEVALERLDALYDSAVEEYLEQREAGKVKRSKLAQK